MIIVRSVGEPRRSMFRFKRRHKWRPTEKFYDRIPTRWRLVIAGLIGSGTGLLILTMWAPGSTVDKSSPSNQSSQLTSEVQSGRTTRIQSFDYEKSNDYCEKEACRSVTCSSIPESLDPGKIASDYMTRVFKIQCPGAVALRKLIFDRCKFPKKILGVNWLNASLPIVELTFSNCALAQMTKGTFANDIFADLKILKIESTMISKMKKWIFEELSNLNELHIIGNVIDEAEYDMLEPIADSLEVLALDESIKDSRVLTNITGGSKKLSVKLASIRGSTIGKLSAKIFRSLPNVVSLYLADSAIESCDVDAFSTARSLKLLDMSNNMMKKLPMGIFSSISNNDACLSLWNNPWNCTCDFQWIQQTMIDRPSTFDRVPKCRTPLANADVDFLSANFCDRTGSTAIESLPTTIESLPTTTTTIGETVETETTQADRTVSEDDELKFMSFTCQNRGSPEAHTVAGRKLLSIEQWKFPSRFRSFYAKSLGDGTILVNLEELPNDVSLIWFPNPEDGNLTAITISCACDIRGPYLLTNLEMGRSYTVCLIKEFNVSPSPFDCLATWIELSTSNDTWLTNDDKPVVVSLSVTIILIVSIVSVISSFLVVRRNPSLLRGSKRIVMVRNRAVEALVLPQGIDKERTDVRKSVQKRFADDARDYVTPLEVGRSAMNSSPRCPGRKDSKASRVSSQYSAGSYVSAIEPSPTDLDDWRNNGKARGRVSCLEDDEPEGPPPLPPNRMQRHVIPSLSLYVEALRNPDSLTFRNDDKKPIVKWID